MTFGTTQTQRKDSLEKKISFERPLVDIGCGEGQYLVPFSRKLKDRQYIGFDIDNDELRKCREKIKHKNIENAKVTDNAQVVFDEMNEREVDVIITEVIEHMELENVIPFVQNILNNLTYNTVLLTTPNNDFNQFYIMNKDFRHDDHRWELGFEEFKEKMGEIVFHETHAMEFFTVGDIVDGICCTSGCRIYKKP